jgi:hypothetical protein
VFVAGERTIRILVQTTTPGGPDDWSVASLSLLTEHLASLHEDGTRFEVTARNREPDSSGDDPVLAALDRSSFDELWLSALDTGEGMKKEPRALRDIQRYVRNLALWLAPAA